jgi:hypothetical protein
VRKQEEVSVRLRCIYGNGKASLRRRSAEKRRANTRIQLSTVAVTPPAERAVVEEDEDMNADDPSVAREVVGGGL